MELEQEENDPNTIRLTPQELEMRMQEATKIVRERNQKQVTQVQEQRKKVQIELERLKKEGVGTAAEQKKLRALQHEVSELEQRRDTYQVVDTAISTIADASASVARLSAYELSTVVLEERQKQVQAAEEAVEHIARFFKERLHV